MSGVPLVGTVAITDERWYQFLLAHSEVTELNFWTPSGRRTFRAPEFSPFFFKLRAPANTICGFAHFAQFSRLPDWFAWESFGLGNGCGSFPEMHERIKAIRARIRYDELTGSDEIGCIQLVSPTFFRPDDWIPQPSDWHPRTQSPVKYDLSHGEGQRIWRACLDRTSVGETRRLAVSEPAARYGEPRLVQPRLGQGTFRVAVLDAYGRACAATGEHSLPALEAAHIRSYSDDGPHEVRNGLLLRADLHRLFDTGYITVTPASTLEVSSRLRDDYRNGRTYYPLHGTRLRLPELAEHRPEPEFLRWHNERKFRG
jgi:putative restriction endonuclease